MPSTRQIRKQSGDKVIRTVCPLGCGISCGVMAHVRDGVLVKVEPGDSTGTSHICARGLSAAKLVYHPERLKYPLKRTGHRGEGKWQRISWDEALDIIIIRLKEVAEKHGPASLSWISDGVGSLPLSSCLSLAGVFGGTFILPAGFGDAAGPCADQVCYGAEMWYGEDYTNRFDNIAFCIVWGNNPADTQPFKWRRIRDVKESGARIVTIDPRFTTTASRADEYIAVRPGTDAALALGMMNAILDRGLQDNQFINEFTTGPFLVRGDNGLYLREKDITPGDSEKYMVWDTVTKTPQPHDKQGVKPDLAGIHTIGGITCKPAFHLLTDLIDEYPPDRASRITDVPADIITRLAVEYATNKPAAIFRGMGCTRTFHGDLSFRAINTLAAVTGNISLRGYNMFHRNPIALLTHGFPKALPLLNMYEAILHDKPYPIRALWMAKHNLINQDPNFNKVTQQLLPRLEFIVTADMFMTTSARYADIVLPVCSFYEFDDMVPPMGEGSHNYLQLQRKVIEPLYESKSDFDIAAALGKKMGLEGYLEEGAEEYIERMLDSSHPSMEGINIDRLKESPVLPSPYTRPDFATPSGRFELYSERLRDFSQELPVYLEPIESRQNPLSEKYPLSFSSTHPKHRVHSMYANIDWIRDMDPEPVLGINPTDAQQRGIRDEDIVRVFNDRGEMKLKARINQGVQPGLVNMSQGWSPGDYAVGTHQALTHDTINPAQQAIYEPNSAFQDTLVQVELAREV